MSVKLLVVDDNKFPRRGLIKSLPKEIDFDITEASNGREALDLLENYKPDMMFLDLTMPVMNGFEVLEQLQKDNVTLDVVVISADIQEKAIERVKALGAKEFLKKPASQEELRRVFTDLGLL